MPSPQRLRSPYLNAQEAIEYGLVDTIITDFQ